ncbi:MAG: hypothetical protein BWY79_02049 [Actinobacteria bacterium ADurb.Bin444]|nr:MAG: hypothetical protein BWY79_02049 [Actinobacteria bacterium ADurb.Bin444]
MLAQTGVNLGGARHRNLGRLQAAMEVLGAYLAANEVLIMVDESPPGVGIAVGAQGFLEAGILEQIPFANLRPSGPHQQGE